MCAEDNCVPVHVSLETKSVTEEELLEELENGIILGSCEQNCLDLCFDGNLCTVDVQLDADTCECGNDDLIEVEEGQKCCAYT